MIPDWLGYTLSGLVVLGVIAGLTISITGAVIRRRKRKG